MRDHSNSVNVRNVYFLKDHTKVSGKGEGQLSSMTSGLRAELPKEMVAGANHRALGVEIAAQICTAMHTHATHRAAALLSLSWEGGSLSLLFRHVLDGLVLLHGSLPVTAIEFLSDHTPNSALIEAVGGNS